MFVMMDFTMMAHLCVNLVIFLVKLVLDQGLTNVYYAKLPISEYNHLIRVLAYQDTMIIMLRCVLYAIILVVVARSEALRGARAALLTQREFHCQTQIISVFAASVLMISVVFCV